MNKYYLDVKLLNI